ncbi:MAG TPA: hypothetical protein VGN08_08390 [Solirubrobacteraceae bacterium]|jgi:hypothetical protein
MARILVQADDDQTVLFDEHVSPIHLSSEHSATQLLERLEWAVEDESGRRRRRPKRSRIASHESALARSFD